MTNRVRTCNYLNQFKTLLNSSYEKAKYNIVSVLNAFKDLSDIFCQMYSKTK